ncbi:MAG TPA: GGDEF domain-containing protein [Elusimicrobiota bacterium]|jgi:diguanylate cyclase (GGDEF)-like protein|nr:GGDEF domain-containing protein [Elusimicrobiota bacterium]
MGESRALTLLGSYGLFAGLSLLVAARPEYGVYAFPAFGLPLIWSDLRRDAESPVILTFLATVAGLVLIGRAPDNVVRLALAAGILGLWVLAAALSAHRGRQSADERALLLEQMSLQDAIRDDERDLKYYTSYEETVGSETRLRRDLSDAAKSLSGTMDAGEVQARLVAVLAARFPAARIEVTGGAGDDPLLLAAQRRRGPVLIKDARAETLVAPGARFASGVAVPFKVMRQPAGFVKLESDKPGAFGPDDVKAADLFATMAALSLENISLYESVHRQATHDALTQLHSHRAFQQRLQEEVLRSGRSQSPLSLVMCDVDHFKSYNDRYGHQAGDHLLKTLAGVLASFARPVDFVARYGGEEFVVILPNFVRSEALQLAEKMRARVAAEPFVFQGAPTHATMSFGVASFPQDATTASQIVRSADERMYRAKNGGRNQVVG